MFLRLKFIQLLLNVKNNLRHIFSIYIFLIFFLIFLFFGFWKVLSDLNHIIVLCITLLIPFFYVYRYKEKFHFESFKSTVYWIEKKNFSNINPITSLQDSPVGIESNNIEWEIHQKISHEEFKKLKYYLPTLNFNIVDQLKVRYLLTFLFAISILWALMSDKFNENLYSIIDFEGKKKETILSYTAWIKPPDYTNLFQKEIDLDNVGINNKIKLKVPINSNLKINIVSTNNKLKAILDEKEHKFEKIGENNYEKNIVIEHSKDIFITNNKRIFKKLYFEVIPDVAPTIKFLSQPEVVNSNSIRIISLARDDYRVKNIVLNLTKPDEFKHFIDESIKFNLPLESIDGQRQVKNYFYKNLSSHIWAGYNSILSITVFDDMNQKKTIEKKMKIPARVFSNNLANLVSKLRQDLALQRVSISEAINKLNFIFDENKELGKDLLIKQKFSNVFYELSKLNKIPLQYSSNLYESLWDISVVIEERKSYLTKKEVENIEQSLLDNIKKKNTEKISNNIKQLKEKINSLIKIENQSEYKKFMPELLKGNLQNELEDISNEIADLLNTGQNQELQKKIMQLKQLSDTLKNPKKIDKEEILKTKRQEDIINKLSDLLNKQEQIMQESFNRAANRGMFEQSSEGSGGKSPEKMQDSLRNTLGNIMREIGASENEIPQELGRADRAMRHASRDLENGKPDRASNAQGRAVEMIQRSVNRLRSDLSKSSLQFTRNGKEKNNLNQREFSKIENSENDGSFTGGKIDIYSKPKVQEAKKIVRELYNRYNDEKKSDKEKKYIKRLLNWY